MKEGTLAPDFVLPDQDGNAVSLKTLRGGDVVVYFYPKDDTPGCTKEACGFRDLWQRYDQLGIRVLGISPDSPESHVKFARKYALPFPLLSDADKTVMSAYRAWGKKSMYGRQTVGVIRSTVWIGPDGKVRKHWARVSKAGDHAARVFDVIRAG
ncbi:MAG: peroxiredoxin [Gemmatimonadales bacterium]